METPSTTTSTSSADPKTPPSSTLISVLSLSSNCFPGNSHPIHQNPPPPPTAHRRSLIAFPFPAGTPANALLSRVPQVLNRLKRKSDYLKRAIPKQGLELVFRKMAELRVPSLVFNLYGGRMAEIPAAAKPFPHRARNIVKLQYAINWDEEGAEAEERFLGLITELYDYMTAYVSMDPREAFLNYRDLDIGVNGNGRNSYAEGSIYRVKYFKGNFERLVDIKTKVDPHNFFRNEQSILDLPMVNHCSR